MILQILVVLGVMQLTPAIYPTEVSKTLGDAPNFRAQMVKVKPDGLQVLHTVPVTSEAGHPHQM